MTTSNASSSASDLFRVPASEIFLYMMTVPRKSWAVWCFAFIGMILLIIGLIFDMRLVAVGLMVWLALVPTAAFFMHYSEALSPKVAPNLLPHSVERIPAGYIVKVFRQQPDEKTGETMLVESKIITVRDSDVVRESVSGIYRRLALSSPDLSLIFIPSSLDS